MVIFLRAIAGFGPATGWAAMFAAVVVAVLVIYLGLALVAVLRAGPDNAKLRYQVFRDLLDLFRRNRRSR
ncbi:hypothetical protein [Actinomadura bangladeshensis]|uniref:Uncharacterized protein n=1 Tax=Actinomadura bangladeshensis TaxID=453573 RepID=A0A4R4PCJ3_9ACTN|nr:hypothetical protein [Actinomadura bangladeshensis]TDC20185.1 hypothetical protein E1284_00875 [Actinomadura bangladeshensis]